MTNPVRPAGGQTIRRGATIAVAAILFGTLATVALPPSLAKYAWVACFIALCVGLSTILHGAWDLRRK